MPGRSARRNTGLKIYGSNLLDEICPYRCTKMWNEKWNVNLKLYEYEYIAVTCGKYMAEGVSAIF